MNSTTKPTMALQTIFIALSAGLIVWGMVNTVKGYAYENPKVQTQGLKQLMAGTSVLDIGVNGIPLLAALR